MQTLRLEGKTEDAARVGYRIAHWVTENPADNSPEAALYHAFNYHFAAVLVRQGAPENIAKAKELIEETLARVDFDARRPAVRGDQQIRLLDWITNVLSRLGEHRRAASIQERLLERAEGAGQLSRIATSANSLVEFLGSEGFRARCATTPESARAVYADALRIVEKGESLNAAHVEDASTTTQEATDLLWRSNRFIVEQGVAELQLDQEDIDTAFVERLEDDQRRAEKLVQESVSNGTITPTILFYRYERLGTAHLLVARAKAAVDADHEVDAIRARVFLSHRYELHRDNRDEPAKLVVRYADACRLAGDTKAAIKILERGLDRLRTRCGSAYDPCRFIEAQLTALRETPA